MFFNELAVSPEWHGNCLIPGEDLFGMAMKRDLLFGLLLLPACVLAADGPGFVAGLQPDRRPAGFATIRAEPPAPAAAGDAP